jgi:DNA polymerase-3 subunit alpha
VIAKVNVTPDKFSGGTRIVAEAVMDIAGARLRFGRNVHVRMDSGIDLKLFRSQINPYLITNRQNQSKPGGPPGMPSPASEAFKGLPLTAVVTASGSACLVQFPDELRLYPDDACLHSLHQLLATNQEDPVVVQYA